MAQWGNTDDAANSVLWGVSQLNLTANTGNQTNLFGNTTADAFVSGATIGQFGVAEGEAVAARAGANTKAAHSGWVLRTVGSGGRAGRVHNEVLVAMNTITGDAEDVRFPDYKLSITTEPANDSANSTANETATFTVVAASAPSGATLGYLWQYTTSPGNTATFATTAAVAGFSGQTTATLTVAANTIADGTLVRALVSTAGAANVTTTSATLTVTT
jgi:hypothetical protein